MKVKWSKVEKYIDCYGRERYSLTTTVADLEVSCNTFSNDLHIVRKHYNVTLKADKGYIFNTIGNELFAFDYEIEEVPGCTNVNTLPKNMQKVLLKIRKLNIQQEVDKFIKRDGTVYDKTG